MDILLPHLAAISPDLPMMSCKYAPLLFQKEQEWVGNNQITPQKLNIALPLLRMNATQMKQSKGIMRCAVEEAGSLPGSGRMPLPIIFHR